MSGYQSLDELLAGIRSRAGCDEPNNVHWIRPEDVAEPEPRPNPGERSIPKSYRWAHVEASELSERVRATDPAGIARGIADRTNVVFIGPAGMGKTSLAVAAFRLRNTWSARFVHAYRLGTARIQHHAGEGEASLVETAMTIPMALIDDVGNERQTATNAVPDVIFERHASGLATWYTTAFEPIDIAKRYGDGVARRMFECATVIRLGAKE